MNSQKTNETEFSILCTNGKVQLPLYPDKPLLLQNLLNYQGGNLPGHFMNKIRDINLWLVSYPRGGENKP